MLCTIKMDKHPYLFLVFFPVIILSTANCRLLADSLGFQGSKVVFSSVVFSLFTGKTSSWEKSVKHGGGVKGQCMRKLCKLTLRFNGIFSLRYKLCVIYLGDFFPQRYNNTNSTWMYTPPAELLSPMLNQARLKCFYRAKHTHMQPPHPGLQLDRWLWSQGEGRLMLQAHYPQCFAGPLPARLRRSLCGCSPAPLIPLLGWTLWPSSSWIPNLRPRAKDLLLRDIPALHSVYSAAQRSTGQSSREI